MGCAERAGDACQTEGEVNRECLQTDLDLQAPSGIAKKKKSGKDNLPSEIVQVKSPDPTTAVKL